MKTPSLQITKPKKIAQKNLATAFKVSERTIRRFLKLRTVFKPGRKPKIDYSTLLSFLDGYVLDNPTAAQPTQQEMADYLTQKTGQPITQQAISWILKNNGITRKKITYHYSEQNMEKVKEFINTKVSSLPQSRILAADESGFPLNLAPRYGYSRKGKRAISYKPGNKGGNHTLIFLIQNVEKKGVIHYQLIKKGMKTQNFYDFLKEVNLPREEKHYLLLDNLSVHRSNKIKELLKQKNIEPTYLPSYTPQLNPVELCFNTIKGYVKRCRPRTEEALRTAIDQAVANLQQQDLTKSFQECWDYFAEKGTLERKEWSKKVRWSFKKRPLPWFQIGKVGNPKFVCPFIYPSWRWLKLGPKPTLKKVHSAQDKVRKCLEKSGQYF
jgi:transposase